MKKKESKSRDWTDRVLEATQQERRRRILRDFVVGIILTLALIFCGAQMEKIPRVQALKESIYDWLQFRLHPIEAMDRIAVIDFSDLQLVTNPKNPSGEGYTSREELKKLVRSTLDQHPAAIGLDVDFSMGDDHTYFSDADEDFLKFCLEQRIRVDGKLFVGINSGLERGPDHWLGSPEFKDLGRFIVHPNSEGLGANPWMDEEVDIPHSENGKTDYWTLQSLSGALVGPDRPSERPTWFAERLSWSISRTEFITREAGLGYKQFLVDFSAIDHFNDNAVKLADLPNKDLKDKIVIIGRGTRGSWPAPHDAFPVPGLRGNAYPGLLHHACAVYTMQHPLYHFTERGRWLLDCVFSFAVFGFITWQRLRYNRRPRLKIDIHKRRKRLTWAVALFVFCIAELAVNYTRIVWADYFVVIIALFLHSWIEDSEENLVELVHSGRAFWYRHTSSKR